LMLKSYRISITQFCGFTKNAHTKRGVLMNRLRWNSELLLSFFLRQEGTDIKMIVGWLAIEN
jgi:hypothetical protein